MPRRIFFLTGASGVGKTTLLSHLKEKYGDRDGWEFVKFDSIGIPSKEDMIKDYGSSEAWQKAKTWEWIGRMVNGLSVKEVIIFEGQANLEFIISGFEKQGFVDYQIILIDCAQEVMLKRLTDERQQPWLASEGMKNWLKFLRNQAHQYGVPIIDTTAMSEHEVVKSFENFLAGKKT